MTALGSVARASLQATKLRMNSGLKQKEALQIAFLALITLFFFAIFFFTPSLRPVTLLTLLNVLILGPVVRLLVKRGIPKVIAILLIYLVLSLIFIFGLSSLNQAISLQWAGLVDALPDINQRVLEKIESFESHIRDWIGIEVNLGFKNSISASGGQLRSWALTHIPSLIGNLASAALLVPIFSFFLLKDGKTYSELYQGLIPARFAKTSGEVLKKISRSLGTFLRAKIFEAVLFGVMTYLGLKIIHAPYAGVFSLIAGISNIIPYLGPFLGAAPPLLIFGFSISQYDFFWPTVLIFLITNLIDNFLIFPVFVARIVNLSPLTLLVAVAVGQELYGVAGMLLAVPAASTIKIILLELRTLIYS